MTTRRCQECGYKFDDGYKPSETLCGACVDLLGIETKPRHAECVYCGESTEFGATRPDGTLVGKFVNRIPVDDGWGCAECSGYECDECKTQIYLDHEVRVEYIDDNGYHYGNYHERCYNGTKHGPANYGPD